MRSSLVAVAVLSLTVSCSTMKSDSGLGRTKVDIIRPEIEIAQTSSVPMVARHVQGGIPVHYALRVGNRSGETITLKRVTVQSMGTGAYDVESTSRPFATTIQPEQAQVVEFWVPANISLVTVMGANGPVTLRATLQFDSPVGQFQEVVVRQVNGMPGRGNAARD